MPRTVELELDIIYDNPGGEAILVSDGDEEVWLPKSQISDNMDGTFTLPEWLAQEKGLI